MKLEASKTIREIVLEIPEAAEAFEKMGIDYPCGGQRSLAEACAAAGLTVQHVLQSLESIQSSEPAERRPDFRFTPISELIDHILTTHHEFTRTELERIRALMVKVCDKHGQNHPELDQMRRIFETLFSELEPHMVKEEQELFPYLIAKEDAVNQGQLEKPPFGTFPEPISMMMLEHDGAAYLLKQMRQLSSDYAIPPDACVNYQTLYRSLERFEQDLHLHIHLENNILFPRGAELKDTDLYG